MKAHPEKLKSRHIDRYQQVFDGMIRGFKILKKSHFFQASLSLLKAPVSPLTSVCPFLGIRCWADRQTDSSCWSRGLALLRLCLGRESVEELLAPRQTSSREEQQKFVERPTQPLGPGLWPLLSSGHALCSSDWSQCHSKWMDGVSLFASSEGSCML